MRSIKAASRQTIKHNKTTHDQTINQLIDRPISQSMKQPISQSNQIKTHQSKQAMNKHASTKQTHTKQTHTHNHKQPNKQPDHTHTHTHASKLASRQTTFHANKQTDKETNNHCKNQANILQTQRLICSLESSNQLWLESHCVMLTDHPEYVDVNTHINHKGINHLKSQTCHARVFSNTTIYNYTGYAFWNYPFDITTMCGMNKHQSNNNNM